MASQTLSLDLDLDLDRNLARSLTTFWGQHAIMTAMSYALFASFETAPGIRPSREGLGPEWMSIGLTAPPP